MRRFLLCIDDTDNLGTPGSGHILNDICLHLQERGLARGSRISRHQLFVHPDVPYTSHNSSMCTILTGIHDEQAVISEVETELRERAAEGSDPGICFTAWDQIRSPELLIDYGRRAKREVLSKGIAYETAKECGLYLNELGGTGDGVIGAVAGIGLRLSGTDGRFRGKLPFSAAGQPCRAGDFVCLDEVDELRCAVTGKLLDESDLVTWLPEIKTVLYGHKSVLPVLPDGDHWRVMDRVELKARYN